MPVPPVPVPQLPPAPDTMAGPKLGIAQRATKLSVPVPAAPLQLLPSAATNCGPSVGTAQSCAGLSAVGRAGSGELLVLGQLVPTALTSCGPSVGILQSSVTDNGNGVALELVPVQAPPAAEASAGPIVGMLHKSETITFALVAPVQVLPAALTMAGPSVGIAQSDVGLMPVTMPTTLPMVEVGTVLGLLTLPSPLSHADSMRPREQTRSAGSVVLYMLANPFCFYRNTVKLA